MVLGFQIIKVYNSPPFTFYSNFELFLTIVSKGYVQP